MRVADTVVDTVADRVRESVRTLPPAYFAFVMATGIVSIGIGAAGQHVISAVLLWVAVAGYLVLLVLSIWRLIAYPRDFIADVGSPANGFAFFTFVAGTDVLAARLIGDVDAAVPITLFVVAVCVWLVMGYAIPWRVVLDGSHDGNVLLGVNGTWFVWAVASQSIAVVASELEAESGRFSEALAIIAVLAWSIGVVLYGAIGVVVVIRVLIRGITPAEFGAPYWITMGAAAITVLVGSRIQKVEDMPVVGAAHGLIAGAAVVFWSFASWLIPALIAAGWWRHVVHRVPLRYEPALWSIVFPLGMYSVASMSLGAADGLPIIANIGAVAVWVALAAWVVVAVALLVRIVRRLTGARGL